MIVCSPFARIEQTLGESRLSLAARCLIIGKASLDFGLPVPPSLQALPADCRPTAIICGNDTLALGVQMGLTRAGFCVPGDFSVTGFDDLELSSRVTPALTTMFVDNKDIAGLPPNNWCICLTGRIEKPQSRQVDVSLRLRESTAAPSTGRLG